jgi:GNAT superfamily N-acetyltransferase
MDPIIIRKASLEDLDILLGFEQAVISAERPIDSTIKKGDIHYYDIKEMINAPNVEMVVAESDHEIIGSGYARIEHAKPYLLHPVYAYLGFMYVKPEHRGKGVNKKIIEALEQWVVSQNITEIRLDVYINNTTAIKAYEKTGFTKHMVEMRKGVRGE